MTLKYPLVTSRSKDRDSSMEGLWHDGEESMAGTTFVSALNTKKFIWSFRQKGGIFSPSRMPADSWLIWIPVHKPSVTHSGGFGIRASG